MKSERSLILVMAPSFGSEPGGVQQLTREVLAGLRSGIGDERLIGLSYADPERGGDGFLECRHVGQIWWRQLAFAVQALRMCWRFRPRLMVSLFPTFSPVCWFCSMLFGIPYVVVAHGIEVWGDLGWTVGFGLRRADLVLPVSQFTADQLTGRHRVPAVRIQIFPNTVDTGRYRPGLRSADFRVQMGLPVDRRLVLTVARLEASERAKGIEDIWVAMQEVDRLADLVHVIGGGGKDLDRMRMRVRELGLGDRVVFVGRVTDADLPLLYREADLFVMPSQKEGFGIVFLEAMASGVPVIACDAGGAPEALDAGRLGWLVDGSCIGLGSAMVEALDAETELEPRVDPEWLHSAVDQRFGPVAFRARLGEILMRFGL